ncbi:MAG: 4Fe-4S dicluster domain-containing protein [Anaerolineae bacterium]
MVGVSVVNTLVYDPARCTGCGLCADVCPHGVFSAPEPAADGRRRAHLLRPEACMECGACQLNCPSNAIAVESGVGCAAAMIWAALTGSKEVVCGPSCGDPAEATGTRTASCCGGYAEGAQQGSRRRGCC